MWADGTHLVVVVQDEYYNRIFLFVCLYDTNFGNSTRSVNFFTKNIIVRTIKMDDIIIHSVYVQIVKWEAR